MDHMPGRQPIGFGDFGAARLAATERAAFIEKPRAGGPMDRTIDPTATEQGRVGRVDNGINAQCRDVGDDDFQPRRT